MNELTQLEEKYGFKYPDIYKELYKDGMLDWGWGESWAATRNWSTEVYPTLLENPPLLLHNIDFGIIQTKSIDFEINEAPEDWDQSIQLIPFGKTGAGDWYAFYMNSPVADSIPIVIAPHDYLNAEYKAKNMQDFIFRQMLEHAAWLHDWKEIKDESKFRKEMNAMIKSHSKYLTPSQVSILTEIYSRPLRSLLSEEELGNIIKNEMDFELLDVEFQYML